MFNDITCVILSGGKSNRMGVNKSLLQLGGKAIIEIIHDKVSKLFGNVIISSNEPDQYRFLNKKIYEDIYPSKGPISGIHSGLVNSGTDKNFFISCDMPLINNELIEYLVNYETHKSIVLPITNDYIQTLCGIYGKETIPYIEGIITRSEDKKEKQRRFSLFALAMDVGAEIVDVTTLSFYEDKIFFNLNDKDDFELIKKMI